jgi:DNA processing protein
MDDARAAWVALATAPGIGPARLHALLAVHHTPLGALSAPFPLLRTVPGMTAAAATAVSSASLDRGRRILELIERCGGMALTPDDPEFPSLLKQIPDAPPVLFASGNLSLLGRPAVAIVGSRDHSAYGAEVCRRVAWAAAEAGVVVASGMARGLDAVAHQAAMDAGGGTVGVLGNGLGVIYPAANRRLYQRVAAEGLLLTEFRRASVRGKLPSAQPDHQRAGAGDGRGGSGRGLRRADHRGHGAGSGTGGHGGARPDHQPGLARLQPAHPRWRRALPRAARPIGPLSGCRAAGGRSGAPSGALTPLPATLTEAQRSVADLLAGEPALVDELIERSGRGAAELLALLSALEIAGVVEQRAGRRFVRV